MKIRIYYHVYLPENGTWPFIVIDQLKVLEESKLIFSCEKFHIRVGGSESQFKLFKDLIKNYPKATVEYVIGGFAEKETVRQIWLDSQDNDFKLLYLHTKGVTAFDKFFTKGDIKTFRNHIYWRKFLEWAVIEKWIECYDSLETHDMAGCNLVNEPLKHYAGNFWWSKSSYIKTLPDIESSEWWENNKNHMVDRLIAEMWPCHKAKSMYNMKSPKPGTWLYNYTMKREEYENIS
jgi:hypothetical protein